MEIKEGQLRIWHIPQVPMNNLFYVLVDTIAEAIKILDILANYDLYQLENKIKPDYSNAQGLEIFEENEWTEWTDDYGSDIKECLENCEGWPK